MISYDNDNVIYWNVIGGNMSERQKYPRPSLYHFEEEKIVTYTIHMPL